MSRTFLAFVVTGVVFAAGGAVQNPPEWPTYRIAESPPGLRLAVQHGDLVIASIQSALLSELTRELDQGGTAGAIKSCHLDATSAAYRIARAEGVVAGRTSDRLRNPTNAPRPWAAPIVQRYAGARISELDGFVVDLGDRIGVLRPIAERPICAGCHGPIEDIRPSVRKELADRYPADRATGFRQGEVRGWFWVEIPKR